MIASTAARRTGDAAEEAGVAAADGCPPRRGTAAAAANVAGVSKNDAMIAITRIAITSTALGVCVLLRVRLLHCCSLGIVRSLTRLRRVRDDMLEAVARGLRE